MTQSTRREFLKSTITATAATATCGVHSSAADERRPSLAGEIGFTTGSLAYQRRNKLLKMSSLPKFVRDDLGMQLIDLNTNWLESYEDSYVRRVRESAEDADCFFTNLKVNHKFGDLYADDTNERQKAMAHARQLVTAARLLGARWMRFSIPKPVPDTRTATLSAHRELARVAESQGIQLLVENNGWMRSDPGSVAELVRIIGKNVAPGPDTGNWNDDVRYEGIAKSFPGAVTCDFKVFDLDSNREHKKYDIRRCFDVAWKTGFRGPWAIEHWNEDTQMFAKETRYLRDLLNKWIVAAS
jgi:hypothetical protein